MQYLELVWTIFMVVIFLRFAVVWAIWPEKIQRNLLDRAIHSLIFVTAAMTAVVNYAQ